MECLIDSIHDNTIESYLVDFETDSIRITTKKHKENEIIQVVFSGVVAHYFENPMKGSILLDIDEHNIENFISNNRKLLEEQKNYGWPILYDNFNELEGFLLKNRFKYFVIYASIGLNGWVVAKSIATNKVEISKTNESII
jgi:hypothetical protein